jgi:hypothetical protein
MTPAKFGLLPGGRPVLFFCRDIVHRHEANYVHVVHVDYVDYDQDDYFRFGRVEKQLAN